MYNIVLIGYTSAVLETNVQMKIKELTKYFPKHFMINVITLEQKQHQFDPKNINCFFLKRFSVIGILKAIRETHRSKKIDLIDVSFACPPGIRAVIVGKIMKIPVIVNVLGMDINALKEFNYEFADEKLVKLAVNLALIFSKRIVAVADSLKRKVLQRRIKESKIVKIPIGIDTDVFNPYIERNIVRKRYKLDDSPMVLSVGKIHPIKGAENLVRAFKIVTKEIADAKLLIVGKIVDFEYFKKIRQFVSKNDIENNVIFTGPMPHNVMHYFFGDCDIYAHVSFSEGCCRSIIEAMACGKAVVASNAGGNPELIRNNYNGYLISPRNYKAIGMAILKLLRDKEIQKSFGEHGRKVALENFSLEITSKMRTALYYEILQ